MHERSIYVCTYAYIQWEWNYLIKKHSNEAWLSSFASLESSLDMTQSISQLTKVENKTIHNNNINDNYALAFRAKKNDQIQWSGKLEQSRSFLIPKVSIYC